MFSVSRFGISCTLGRSFPSILDLRLSIFDSPAMAYFIYSFYEMIYTKKLDSNNENEGKKSLTKLKFNPAQPHVQFIISAQDDRTHELIKVLPSTDLDSRGLMSQSPQEPEGSAHESLSLYQAKP